jgi:hypothetical protein
MNAAKISRVLILGTTALVAAGSVIYIQTRFDEADAPPSAATSGDAGAP